ncbi:hypothetical protein EV356DRAFT_534047 [Viridothelium virens]|uniref:Cytochrome P450 n=1 Tax=Viridothelium virens TaxID=1048519 RepID=A0A6A6H5N2_VIRVR|nr:hypothetical protein EV356DRAFT_534047 [Viridothelium virens]
MDGTPSKDSTQKAVLAFGYGSRRCLGKNIALSESQKFVIQLQLLRDFAIRIKGPEKPCRTENRGIIVHWEQDMILQSRRKWDEPGTLAFDEMKEKSKV